MHKEKNGSARKDSMAAFVEELVIRRELSDNFCLYNQQYDSSDGFPDWAKKIFE
jgi:deoxyribodipyrimidine photo-lyase